MTGAIAGLRPAIRIRSVAQDIVGAPIGLRGAAYRTRTCDPIITNDVLYQLS